jgi:hypothetical protein
MSTIHARVMDGRMLSARQSDAMLTTKARLTAEPPPPLPDGALGVLYDGNFLGGRVPAQADLDAALAKVVSDPSLLSVKERADIGAIISRFSGRSNGPVSGVGITSNDSASDMARASVATVAQGVAQVQQIQRDNDAFWDRQMKLMATDVG